MTRILAAVFVSVFVVIPCNAQEKTILKNKEFRGVTQAGIGWGMRQKTAKQAYGEPELTVKRSGGEKWERRSKGILIWFNRGRVNQIVIFRPQ
jgi:hypothetical protein